MEKEINKMTKKELIAHIKEQERPLVNNKLENMVITVNANECTDDTEAINNLSKSLLNLSEIMKDRFKRPVYGVYLGSDGITRMNDSLTKKQK